MDVWVCVWVVSVEGVLATKSVVATVWWLQYSTHLPLVHTSSTCPHPHPHSLYALSIIDKMHRIVSIVSSPWTHPSYTHVNPPLPSRAHPIPSSLPSSLHPFIPSSSHSSIPASSSHHPLHVQPPASPSRPHVQLPLQFVPRDCVYPTL